MQSPTRKTSFSSMNGAFSPWCVDYELKNESGTPKRLRVGNNNSGASVGSIPQNVQSRPGTPQLKPNYIPVVVRCTVNLLDLYRKCNPKFRYTRSLNPKRVLTKECRPIDQFGRDNQFSDLILHVNDRLSASNSRTNEVYHVKELLGQGTFGQVVKCEITSSASGKRIIPGHVAVKVIKSKPAYYNQALVEVAILKKLNSKEGTIGRRRIVNLLDSFTYHGHLCLVFELLAINLFEVVHQNKYRGLRMSHVKSFTAQILEALCVLAQLGIVHCDLKPENILLEDLKTARIKVIDFGSACFENQTVYTYIQSRFYRAPEVLMGLPYSRGIDVWSLGCIVLELFLGLPVFPGVSEHNQLARIIELLGYPPVDMINQGKSTRKFFTRQSPTETDKSRFDPEHLTLLGKESYAVAKLVLDNERKARAVAEAQNRTPPPKVSELPPQPNEPAGTWRLKSALEWSRTQNKPLDRTKRYFKETNLSDVIYKFTTRIMPADGQHGIDAEMNDRKALLNLVQGLLQLDPQVRWTAKQASSHPFVTGAAFAGTFTPKPDSRKKPAACRNVSISNTQPKQVAVTAAPRNNAGKAKVSTASYAPPITVTTCNTAARVSEHFQPMGSPASALSANKPRRGYTSGSITTSNLQQQVAQNMGSPSMLHSASGIPGTQPNMTPQQFNRRPSLVESYYGVQSFTGSPLTPSHLSPPSRPMHPYPLAHAAQWDRVGSLGGYPPSMMFLDDRLLRGMHSQQQVDQQQQLMSHSIPVPAPNNSGSGFTGQFEPARPRAMTDSGVTSYSLPQHLSQGGMSGATGLHLGEVSSNEIGIPTPGSTPSGHGGTIYNPNSILARMVMLDEASRGAHPTVQQHTEATLGNHGNQANYDSSAQKQQQYGTNGVVPMHVFQSTSSSTTHTTSNLLNSASSHQQQMAASPNSLLPFDMEVSSSPRNHSISGTSAANEPMRGDAPPIQRRPRGQSESFTAGTGFGYQTSPNRHQLNQNALRRNSFHISTLDGGIVPYRFSAASWAVHPVPQPLQNVQVGNLVLQAQQSQRKASQLSTMMNNGGQLMHARNNNATVTQEISANQATIQSDGTIKPLSSPPSLDNWTPFFSNGSTTPRHSSSSASDK